MEQGGQGAGHAMREIQPRDLYQQTLAMTIRGSDPPIPVPKVTT